MMTRGDSLSSRNSNASCWLASPRQLTPSGVRKPNTGFYQPPIDNPSEEETSFLDDWEDFVTTGFRQEFADALAVVEADLQNCVPLGW